MATLGDLLAFARRNALAFEGWIGEADPDLAMDIAAAAERHGLEPCGFIRMAISDFSRLANEEDWATLISSIRDAADPGMTCLSAMVQWRMTVSGCREHETAMPQGISP